MFQIDSHIAGIDTAGGKNFTALLGALIAFNVLKPPKARLTCSIAKTVPAHTSISPR